jgi:hypothetical protein
MEVPEMRAGPDAKTEVRMTVRVECYAGHKGDERPTRFQLGEQWLPVEAVLDRWYDPHASYFRVRAGDGVYILRHEERECVWTLESFRAE